MELKEHIVLKAQELFFQHGLRRVTITDICSELRISKKTFYTVFKQKEDLVLEVLLSHKKKKLLVDEDLTFRQNLEKCAKLVFDEVQMEKHANFFFDLGKYYPDVMKIHTTNARIQMCKDLRQLCEIGRKEGVVRDNINYDFLTCILHRGIFSQYRFLRDETGFTHKAMAMHIFDTFVRMVCTVEAIVNYEKEINETYFK